MSPSLKLLIVLIVNSALLIGVLDVIFNVERNGCEMTYMYENPEYIRVPLSSKMLSKFPKYNLYVYGEGFYAQSLRSFNLHGIPVLFIPGNSGSHKQVRSLASVAFRKSENLPFLFNYFSVDLNEEISALNGGTLQDQTEFVGFCVKKILRLYKKARNPPSSVVVIGHSMGGLVARALFTLPDFDSSSIHTIITLATPHQSPVIVLDNYVSRFYEKVNEYWIDNSHTTLANITILSTGGGERDYQVPVWATSLDNIVLNGLGISTVTTSIPNAWVSTDHLCTVWCRQIVLIINRALFDMVDRNTNQITSNADFRLKVLNTYVHNHPGKIGPMRSWKKKINIEAKAPWILKEETSLRYSEERVTKLKYVVIPVATKDLDQFIAVSNVHSDSWVCGCKIPEGKQRCDTCTNLADKGHALLPRNSNKKYVLLEVSELAEYSHIILVIAPNLPPVSVSAEFYSSNERHLLSPLPTWFTLPFTFSRNAMYYRMHFQNKNNILKAYNIHLIPQNCKTSSSDDDAGSVMSLKFSWTNLSTYKFIRKNEAGNITLKLLVPIPDYINQADASLHLFLNPDCNYGLKIDWALKETLGQFMRHYASLMPAFCVAHLLLALNLVLTSRRRNRQITIMDAVWAQKTDWIVVLPLVYIVECVLSHEFFAPYFDWLPTYNSDGLQTRGIWGKSSPPLLAAVTFAITYFHVAFVTLFFKVARLVFSFLIGQSRLFFVFCYILLAIVLIFSLVVAKSLCGSISILLSYMIYFFKVIYVGEQVKKSNHSSRNLNFALHQLIWVLWQWLMIFNMAPLIAWQRQLPKKLQLTPDSSQIIGFVTPFCISLLCICNNIVDRINQSIVSPVFYVCVLAILLYGTVHLYCVSMFVLVPIGLLSLFSLRPLKDGE
ncbi:GPI inositol-deacylase isoform X2 [Octopus sinensis]|uniref:GPI inositol-deacylase n=1 Tax=Octopus sinensis TaxID=2607531 RepID=A0A6P7TGN7_9MOLL|nr:GPI inositol-deacylase isoform X2 [Octopus sinensis]